MNSRQGRELLDVYRKKLSYVERRAEEPLHPSKEESLSHVVGMLDKMEGLLDVIEGAVTDFNPDKPLTMATEKDAVLAMGKFNLWRGFVQGVLWSANIYTIDEIREHNR